MKSIRIAKVIAQKRRESGLTQDDLARFLGVSKASVSKWEIGQSYPDITLLPKIASYFRITIDELMCYESQMSKEEIRNLYVQLCADFVSKPFDEVVAHCEEIVKDYYACFPLLFQIGALLVNNCTQAQSTEKKMAVIARAKELFVRVKQESDEPELCQISLNMVACCALMQGNAEEVIDLLSDVGSNIISTETLLAPAYQMLGKIKEAKYTMQAGIYQHMGALFSTLGDYMLICTDTPVLFEKTYRRALQVAEAFDIANLHPALLAKCQLIAAQGYTTLGEQDKALTALEAYTALLTGNIYPLKLKGDAYFQCLDEWIDKLDLGSNLPRDEKLVRQSLIDGVVKNPTFAAMANEPRFAQVVQKLTHTLGGNSL